LVLVGLLFVSFAYPVVMFLWHPHQEEVTMPMMLRIESNVRFSKHQVQRWLEDRSFQPRPVNGKGAKRQ
jgi:hypothetical protein